MEYGQIPANIHTAGHGMLVGDDRRVIVRFYPHATQNVWQTQQQGMPVYDTVDMVSIQHPGERDVLHRKVTDEIIARFPSQWAAYREQREQVAVGTPITLLFDGQPDVVQILRDVKITTIEQLAAASEEAIKRIGMGGRGHVEKAKTALRQIQDTAPLQRAEAEITRLTDEIAAMRAMIDDLSSRLGDQQKRGPGRPKKELVEEGANA